MHRCLRPRRRWALCPVLGACLLVAVPVCAQRPAPSVTVSFGVDTTAADVGEIVQLVRAYLARPDTSAIRRGLWSSADSLDRRAGDLHAFFAYQGFPATVVGVQSAGGGADTYVVKVLHGTADSTGQQLMPLALQRLYAVRAPGLPYRWQLSNALPRLTRDWPVVRAGRLVFHYAPGQRPDRARALGAARFVDSIAVLFAAVPPERLDYYVTASPDEYFRAVGLDFFPLPSGRGTETGGNALPAADIVLAGDPAQGEAYLHEIAHVVLRGRVGGGPLLGEGVPTWLGGSKGRAAREMYRLLVEYQGAHPDVTLDSLVHGAVHGTAEDDDARHASGALFVDSVYRRSGKAALRALADLPNDPTLLLAAVRRRLGLSSSDSTVLERWWRETARTAARRTRR